MAPLGSVFKNFVVENFKSFSWVQKLRIWLLRGWGRCFKVTLQIRVQENLCRAKGLACADLGARTPIGASGNLFIFFLKSTAVGKVLPIVSQRCNDLLNINIQLLFIKLKKCWTNVVVVFIVLTWQNDQGHAKPKAWPGWLYIQTKKFMWRKNRPLFLKLIRVIKIRAYIVLRLGEKYKLWFTFRLEHLARPGLGSALAMLHWSILIVVNLCRAQFSLLRNIRFPANIHIT